MAIKNLLYRISLTLLSSFALIFAISSINVTCCGPGYQSRLPDELTKYKKFTDETE